MIKKLPLLCALLLLHFAQAQNYGFSVQNAPYVPLTNSTSINNGAVWDSWTGFSATAPLGFNFIANGNLTTNALHFDSNFIPTVVFSNQPNPNSGFVYALMIADTADRGIVNGVSQSPISYKVEGTAGSRIFKLEWSNFGFYDEIASDNISSDFMNMQLWLYEGTNIIEYRFGPSNISNPFESFSGEPGFGCGLYPVFDMLNGDVVGNAYALSGNGTNPTSAFTPNYEVYITTPPASGTVYRFTPTSLSTNEVVKNKEVEIFPTLVDDFVTIKSKTDAEITSIAIFDMSGRRIKYMKDSKSEKIDLNPLTKGIYYIVVQTNSGVFSERVVKN